MLDDERLVCGLLREINEQLVPVQSAKHRHVLFVQRPLLLQAVSVLQSLEDIPMCSSWQVHMGSGGIERLQVLPEYPEKQWQLLPCKHLPCPVHVINTTSVSCFLQFLCKEACWIN